MTKQAISRSKASSNSSPASGYVIGLRHLLAQCDGDRMDFNVPANGCLIMTRLEPKAGEKD